MAVVAVFAVACGEDTGVGSGPGSSDASGNSTVDPTTTGVGDGGVSGELSFGLLRCDPEAPLLAADPAFYRDEPVYVGNEQPIEQVRAWALAQPGFEDIWIDRDRNGWISVGFSESAAARQAELEAEFPGVGVVAVEVTAADRELQALRGQVEEALQGLSSWGVGYGVHRGLVEVSVPVLDEDTLARLAPLAGPMLCVSGADPADAVADGPQPTGGEGWRLLGTDRTGPIYRTGVATTAGQYEDLWAEAGLAGPGPAVDFESEIVIWFGAVYGSSCPIRLDDVAVDTDRRLVFGGFVKPGNPTICTDDANPEAYVVALARHRLPEAPFAVQLDAEDPPSGAPEERTTVLVDLRAPGAMASADDLVVEYYDPNQPPRPPRFEPGLVIENGYPWPVLVDMACQLDVFGTLNGTMWEAIDPTLVDGPPHEWAEDLNDGFAEAELLLGIEPARLSVTINGTTVNYEPIPTSEPAAMICN